MTRDAIDPNDPNTERQLQWLNVRRRRGDGRPCFGATVDFTCDALDSGYDGPRMWVIAFIDKRTRACDRYALPYYDPDAGALGPLQPLVRLEPSADLNEELRDGWGALVRCWRAVHVATVPYLRFRRAWWTCSGLEPGKKCLVDSVDGIPYAHLDPVSFTDIGPGVQLRRLTRSDQP